MTCEGCSTEIAYPKRKWCSNQCKFRTWKKLSGYVQIYSPEVRHRADHNYYVRRREWLIELKSSPCSDCGGMFPPECMDFDHVRGEKRCDIAQLAFRASKETILDEISKCDLVCANCHRIRTARRKREN